MHSEVQRADLMLSKSPVGALFLFEKEYMVKNCSVEDNTKNMKHTAYKMFLQQEFHKA